LPLFLFLAPTAEAEAAPAEQARGQGKSKGRHSLQRKAAQGEISRFSHRTTAARGRRLALMASSVQSRRQGSQHAQLLP
jgi:hypothetical protein